MYSNVPMTVPTRVYMRLVGEPLRGRLRHAKINDARHRLAVHFAYQDVRGLEVAMDDRLLMRVLHSFTDLDEHFNPLSCRQSVLVAIGRDG